MTAEDEKPSAKAEFDGAALNREFALVIMGSKAVVYCERPSALRDQQKTILTLDAFETWLGNRFTEVRGADGKIKVMSLGKAWRQWSGRRQFQGIEFFPDPHDAPATPGYLNLWSGFAVQPSERSDPSRYAIFRDHLLNNICQGSEALFDWVFGFFAHMVQFPRERPGVALVLRGKMGTGKTIVGEVFGSLFPAHYFLVDDLRYITGNFNAHMASCLLLQADEAVWAGDKKAEGRLKGLITSSVQQIEAKGVDPIRLPNYVRLLMTSNENWVVPAGKDERRFCVLDVHPRCARNHEYFGEMVGELAAGGTSYLLTDLLDFPLTLIDVREIPKTLALFEQKVRSLDSIESWWFERLQAGAPTHRHAEWATKVPTAELFSDYVATAEKVGYRRRSAETAFGMTLAKIIPGLGKRRSSIVGPDGVSTTRSWCYVLPPLVDARDYFEELVHQPILWPVTQDDEDDASGGRASPRCPTAIQGTVQPVMQRLDGKKSL
jgi:Family of unknown function (DUF5906)